MTERRAKRVTHAQSPYITVGACKLFNSPAYPMLAGEPFLSLSPIFLFFPLVLRTRRGPTIIEAQLDRGKRTVTRLNVSTSSVLFLLSSFNILSALLPSSSPTTKSIYNSVCYSRSFSGRAFIFFQPLLRRASPVPGLCQGLGGGLSDYPDGSPRNPSHGVII